MIIITEKISKLNEKCNSISSSKNDIFRYIEMLNRYGNITVGYRTCCGSTHGTQKAYRIWEKVVKEIEKEHSILKEILNIGNAYATNNGGFWNEIKYTLK